MSKEKIVEIKVGNIEIYGDYLSFCKMNSPLADVEMGKSVIVDEEHGTKTYVDHVSVSVSPENMMIYEYEVRERLH